MCYVISECHEYIDEYGEMSPRVREVCYFIDKYTATLVMDCLREKYPHKEYSLNQMPEREAIRQGVLYCKVVMNQEGIAV